MTPSLPQNLRSFFRSSTAISSGFAGKREFRIYLNNYDSIRHVFDHALEVLGYSNAVKTARKNNDKMIKKSREAKTAFDQWNAAKTRYDSSLSDVRKYARKLAQSRRARNSKNIKKYTVLLETARRNRTRSKPIMDSKWHVFTAKAGDVVVAFIPVWNSYEDLKTRLLLP